MHPIELDDLTVGIYHRLVCVEADGTEREWYHSKKDNALSNQTFTEERKKTWYIVPVEKKADCRIVEIGEREYLQ